MARATVRYVCQACGASHRKWMGRCEACGAWNTLVEEARAEAAPKGLGKAGGGRALAFVEPGRHADRRRRAASRGIAEFDRVTGGGLVPGSALLIGGDPGIGKSTLLLQVVPRRSAQGLGAASTSPARRRSTRCGCAPSGSASPRARSQLAAATSVRDIVATPRRARRARGRGHRLDPDHVCRHARSAPGTVAQVRASAQELIRLAKRRGIAVLLVGHVTKEGLIAGPRVLEHMVDTVLYFEGERGHQFRILRAVKNRFGPTDEIGVFEMTDARPRRGANPSALFLAERARRGRPAPAVFAGIEGTRPMLVEIQALVAPSSVRHAAPRRGRLGRRPPGHDAGRARGAVRPCARPATTST